MYLKALSNAQGEKQSAKGRSSTWSLDDACSYSELWVQSDLVELKHSDIRAKQFWPIPTGMQLDLSVGLCFFELYISGCAHTGKISRADSSREGCESFFLFFFLKQAVVFMDWKYSGYV